MIDRLRQMAIFAKTIDHGSFRGAARELKISPSVVSHHISQLEEHLGVALIYRTTRKLTLTNEGAKLLQATRKMLDAVEGELYELSATASEPSGELKLTVPSVLSQSQFIDNIADFSKSYPRIQLSLDFSDVRRGLVDEGFDLAIRMGPKAKGSPTSRLLFKVERRLVASTEYLASRSMPAAPADLIDLDWVALAPAQYAGTRLSHADGRSETIKPEARLTTNDAQALYRLARAGAGVAIVPQFLAEKDAAAGLMKIILPEWELPPIDVYAVWPANAPKHGLIHLAVEALGRPVLDS